MAIKLNHKDKNVARQILEIQLPAYRIEAEKIGFHGIPQLEDTVKSIVESDETFLGYKDGGNLLGVLSYVENDNEIEICRLVVHPTFFRRGIAKKLLVYVLSHNKTVRRITVSTEETNVPAMALYQGCGFRKYDETEIASGVYLAHLERKSNGRA